MDLDDAIPYITDFVFRKCGQDWRVWESQMTDYELTYIIRGKARYTINGVKHEADSGDLLCLADGDIYEAATYPHHLMQCFSVNFKTTFSDKKAAGGSLFPAISHIGLRRDVIGMFRELNLSWTERQPGYLLKSRAMLMLIIHRLSEIAVFDVDSAPGDYRINRITRYMAVHFADKLTVKGLARQVNLDVVYFGHLFKRETGMTIHQYLNKIRVQNAEDMLHTGNYKIHEVAELCGFSDIFHFYKSFKTLRGFAPSRCIPRR